MQMMQVMQVIQVIQVIHVVQVINVAHQRVDFKVIYALSNFCSVFDVFVYLRKVHF